MNIADMQILVVDDSKIMRRIVGQKLQKMGAQKILTAQNGRAALDVLETTKVSLIISDWSMPGMSGIDFLAVVRDDPRFGEIPFIFLSAEAQLYNILMAYRLRVDEYITKPFTDDYFKYVMTKVISSRQLM